MTLLMWGVRHFVGVILRGLCGLASRSRGQARSLAKTPPAPPTAVPNTEIAGG